MKKFYANIKNYIYSRDFESLSQFFLPERIPIGKKFWYMRPSRVIILNHVLCQFHSIIVAMKKHCKKAIFNLWQVRLLFAPFFQ